MHDKHIHTGMIQFGFNNVGNLDPRYERLIIEIVKPGKVIFTGRSF